MAKPKPKIAVHCKYDKLLAANAPELKPHPQNPNQHPWEQLVIYERVIRSTGIRRPVVISNQSGYINRGHGLVLVCARIGCKVPVEFQDFKSEREEIASLIADKKIPELSEFDEAAAASLTADFSADELLMTGLADPGTGRRAANRGPGDPDAAKDGLGFDRSSARAIRPGAIAPGETSGRRGDSDDGQ